MDNHSGIENAPAQTVIRSKSKVVFLGEQSVGKSSLITRFMSDQVSIQYVPTIGIDFFTKNITINDIVVRLQIWDTAGQERFRSLIPTYVRDADVAVIVFDVTCARSFERTNQWYDYVKRERRGEVIVILVANKADLVTERQISIDKGNNVATKWQCPYFDVSALTGQNVTELFDGIAEATINKPKQPSENGGFSMSQTDGSASNAVSKCWC